MSNYWQEEFEKTGADGIQFVGLGDTPWNIRTSYGCKTKEEMLAGCTYPRSNYIFYKIVNGKKEYIITDQYKRIPGEVPVNVERTPVFMVINAYTDAPVTIVRDRATAEELCLALTEENAYHMAYTFYTHHHHWSMERAAKEAWKCCLLDYLVYETSIVDFFS